VDQLERHGDGNGHALKRTSSVDGGHGGAATAVELAPAAETVTFSLTSPTCRTKSTCAVCETCATRFVISSFLNPGCDAAMSYLPGTSDGKE